MATRTRAALPLLFLLACGLLFAAAVGTSREEEESRSGEHSLRECQQRCERDKPRYQRGQCVQECREQQQKWEREHGRHEEEQGRSRRGDREREGEQEQDSRRPYVFGPRSFRHIVQSDQGFIKAIRPFNEESRLLRGIKNYRVAIMEANPRSFVVPGYADADGIGYVAQGEGVLTVIENGEKRSYTVRQGDVIVAPAGSIMHLANTDGRRKLVIAKILHTISVPGKFEYFVGQSLVSSLSKRVQRAAFKTSEERLEKLFGRQGQKKGFIVRASEEQVRELRRHASEGGESRHWPLPPFGGDSRSTYNLLEQRPTIANRHGRLYEADARSFRALGDQDVRVAFANITAGSMTAPYYNTQSVKIAVVLDGEGEVEIVCPHLSQDSERRRGEEGQSEERGKDRRREEEDDDEREQHQEQGRGRGSESESESEGQHRQQQEKYETIRARVSRGSVFVVPPGHPVVEISSSRGSSNLQVVCFEIRAEKSERVWLAGKNNVLGKLDRPAKELALDAPERVIDEVLRAQPDEGFLAGPEEQQQERGEEERRRRGDRGRGDEAVETFLRMATGAF
uniref:Uncharacterized protein n=1 Tax=Avena sativa TaxID=4498 RepID=A0ACD5X2Q2_AVESA